MKSHVLRLLTLAAVLALPAWPQAGNGSVRGTVRDQADAVIPGAQVKLINTATKVSAATTTNEVGFYVFPVVTPGPYELTVEAAGLSKFQATFVVQTQQSATIEAQLKVATETAMVTVEATPLVNIDTTSLGNVFERRRIEMMPINGRSIGSLLAIVPGMEESSRAYGVRRGAHDFFFDGASLFDALDGSGTVTRPPGLDTIEEFKVENGSSSAKFSRLTSVIMTSRSGTNSLHGSLFWTHRNNAVGKARTRTDGNTFPQLIRSEYGASAGGPVYLPRAYDGRNKTFWFAAFEGTRFRQRSSRLFTVPTDAMRQGDFSNLRDAQGRLITLYDPLTTNTQTWERQPFNFGGRLNVIDPNRISPLARSMFAVIPQANLPNINPLVAANFNGFNTRLTDDRTITVRLDHHLSQADRIYGRVTRGNSYRDDHTSGVPPMLDRVANFTQRPFSNLSIALNWTRTFSPTFINEVSLSGSRERGYIVSGDPTRDYAGELGLPNPLGERAYPVLGTLNIGATGNYFQPVNYRARFFNFFILEDNATLVRGKHELQFGLHLRLDQLYTLPQQQQTAGLIQFDSLGTSLYNPATGRVNPGATPLTGHNLGNMFLGVARYSYRAAKGKYYNNQWEDAFYLQDNWRVSSRLKLNLGIRWQISPFMREKNNVFSTFDEKQKAIVFGQDIDTLLRLGTVIPSVLQTFQRQGVKFITYKEAGLPQKLGHTNWRDVGPHLGAAYRIGAGKREFLLRGGYQLSYHPLPIYGWNDQFRQNTPFSTVFQNNPNSAALSPDGIGGYLMRSVPTVIAGRNSANAITLENPGLTLGDATARYWDPHYPTSRVHDFNVTLEKEVTGNTVARVGWVGNHQTYQDQYLNYNQPVPAYIWYVTQRRTLPTGATSNVVTRPFDNQVYGTLQRYTKIGWGNYSGMRLELERRYSKGVGFQIFYVVGNNLSTSIGGTGGWDGGELRDPNQFLPNAVPGDPIDRLQLLNYKRDSSVPKHRVRWNWIVELPFGRGKWLGRNTNSILNHFIGGWQLAGSGTVRSHYFELPGYGTGIPTGAPVEVYGKKYPIEDCRSGTCFPGYLWWNGYIPVHQINSTGANGRPNGIMGVPQNYRPAVQPLIPYGSTTPPVNFPGGNLQGFWDTNTVWLRLADGTVQQTSLDDNLHPFRFQYMPAPWEWGQDASLFKEFAVGEAVRIRLNIDAFNVFNNPGIPSGVGSNGLVSTRSSGRGSRELQFTMRVSW